MPFEFWRWKIAEQYGWTLGEVDALSLQDYINYHQVRDGMIKHNNSLLRR